MSNAVMHQLQELVAKYTTICSESDIKMRETTQKRVRQFTDLTEKQTHATRMQGYIGFGAAGLGFLGIVAANSQGFGNAAKPFGTICSQGGNVFSSLYAADEKLLAGRAGLVQNHFLPEGKQTLEKSHQFIQGLLSNLSRLQEQSARSGIVH